MVFCEINDRRFDMKNDNNNDNGKIDLLDNDQWGKTCVCRGMLLLMTINSGMSKSGKETRDEKREMESTRRRRGHNPLGQGLRRCFASWP